MDEPSFYTAKEVGDILKIARSTVIKLILTKRLSATIVGKQYRISTADIEEFRQRNTIKAE